MFYTHQIVNSKKTPIFKPVGRAGNQLIIPNRDNRILARETGAT